MAKGKAFVFILCIISLLIISINGYRTVVFLIGEYDAIPPLWLVVVDFFFIFTTEFQTFHFLLLGVFISLLIVYIIETLFHLHQKFHTESKAS